MKTGGVDNLIIDGNNLLYRIFWTSNYKIEEKDNPGQIFLFLRSLKSYVDKFRPHNVYCTWDKKLEWPSTNFRREATTVEYKAGRDDEKFKDVF
jgi:5'-3' exonuclease